MKEDIMSDQLGLMISDITRRETSFMGECSVTQSIARDAIFFIEIESQKDVIHFLDDDYKERK